MINWKINHQLNHHSILIKLIKVSIQQIKMPEIFN